MARGDERLDAPEWLYPNASNPHVTLVELFAYVGESSKLPCAAQRTPPEGITSNCINAVVRRASVCKRSIDPYRSHSHLEQRMEKKHNTRLRLSAGVVSAGLCFALLSSPAIGQDSNARASLLLEEFWRSGGAPGISVAVASKGKLVFSRSIGFADLENMVPASSSTVYNIGSVSKEISAVAVMQLVERGLVDLDDPIQEYVPAFLDKGSTISIWHIMTHTSGIRHYGSNDFPNTPDDENVMPIGSLEEGIKLFKDDPLLFEPGEYYRYSSYAVNLLQGVVETASGTSFERYLTEHVWVPAGMLHTGFDIPARIVPGRAKSYKVADGRTVNYSYGDLTYKFAGGGMVSTAEDLIRFALALTRGRLLTPETTAWMFTPQLENAQSYNERGALRWRQCLMWRIRNDDQGRPYINAAGDVKGMGANLVIYVDEELIAATVDNLGSLGLGRALEMAEIFRTP